jgi:hypothetical protein
MDLEIKRRWVEALKSGKYQQGKKALQTDEGFCCLGVLCDLYSKEKNIPWRNRDNNKSKIFLGHVGLLPDPVKNWAGLYSSRPFVGDRSLIALNDEGRPFSIIAKLIDSNL